MQTPDISPLFDKIRGIYRQRRKAYGDSYLTFGKILHSMFPEGITLKGVEQFMVFGLLVHILTKLARLACRLPKMVHSDSLQDMAVYALLVDGVANGDVDLLTPEPSCSETFYLELFDGIVAQTHDPNEDPILPLPIVPSLEKEES